MKTIDEVMLDHEVRLFVETKELLWFFDCERSSTVGLRTKGRELYFMSILNYPSVDGVFPDSSMVAVRLTPEAARDFASELTRWARWADEVREGEEREP